MSSQGRTVEPAHLLTSQLCMFTALNPTHLIRATLPAPMKATLLVAPAGLMTPQAEEDAILRPGLPRGSRYLVIKDLLKDHVELSSLIIRSPNPLSCRSNKVQVFRLVQELLVCLLEQQMLQAGQRKTQRPCPRLARAARLPI